MSVRLIVLSIVVMVLCAVGVYAQFSIVQLAGNPGYSCDVTKNINTDYGAVGDGLTDDRAAFMASAGSFNDWAVNTYQPANPGKTICLTSQPGKTYFFGSASTNGQYPFDGIKSFVYNANGSGIISYINLSTTATTSPGACPAACTLTFGGPGGVASGITPSVVQSVADLTNTGAIAAGIQVASTTATTVVLTGPVSSTVQSGDVIQFTGNGYHLGTKGSFGDNLHSALLEAVTAGDTVLKFINSSDVSIFSTGWNFIGGVDQQGTGDPQNLNRWEHVNITALHTGTTGGAGGDPSTATLASPVRFSYKTTWPHYSPGSSFDRDEGGPVELFVLPPSWDATHIYNDLVIWGITTVANAHGHNVTFNRCVTHTWGINIAETMNLTFNNCDQTDNVQVEMDKLALNTVYNGGAIASTLNFTASMGDKITMNNVHILRGFAGTAGNLVLNNVRSDLGIGLGANANGATQLVSCLNSIITGGITPVGISDTALGSTVTMSGGLITVPRSVEIPSFWAVPGVHAFLSSGSNVAYGIPFDILDITADSTNSYVQTSFAGGFPPSIVNKNIVITAQSINFSGCTGDPLVVDWSQAGAQNAPPFTYSHRIYTCTNNVSTIQSANPGVPVIDLNSTPAAKSQPAMARTLTSMVIAVSPADTSAAPTVNWHALGQFDNYGITLSSGAQSTWGIDIDLRKSGTRTYTGSTATWSSTAMMPNGDILNTTPNPTYMGGPMAPFLDQNISGEAAGVCPVVTVTIQSN